MKATAGKIIKAFKEGNKLLICGNGGSAGQAQHLAGELVCKYQHVRKPLPAIALTTDTSTITAIANDFGYEHVFSRQVDALGKRGDILLTMTTSGTSENVINAENMALKKGMEFIRLPCDGQDTPTIQEGHLRMIHEICEWVEKAIKEKSL